MTDIIIPTGDMPVTAKVTTVGKGIIAAQVSAAGAELAQDAAKAATEATEATKEATDNANNATAAAKTATSDAKKATTAANSAADAAKTATANANNATSAAKTATTNANTATDAAKTATTAANKAADRANTAAGNAESIVSGAVATPRKAGVVYIAAADGTTAGTQYNTACSMAFYNTAATAMGEMMDAELNGMRNTVALTEDAGAASRNYAVGEFFYDESHNLCRVTHAVSQGASLVSGTNYTTVSGGVQQYIGTPTYVYATAPSEATVKAAHATPCFVYVVDTASFYYVS